ncbi:histidine kinase [Rothia sp. P4278]|uniref:sensor histidine kinase n=1 Tax=Rothia sp. P4278 TaxID=3402658 RepID=UPI003ADC1E9D
MTNISHTQRKEPSVRSLWRRMASPFYVFSAGPWLALATLLAQSVISGVVFTLTASLIGIVLLPFAAIGFGLYERWRLKVSGYGQIRDGHVSYPGENFFDGLLFRLKEVATWREVGSLALTTVWGLIAGWFFLFVELGFLAVCVSLTYYTGIGNRLYIDWGQIFGLYSEEDFQRLQATNGGEQLSGPFTEIAPELWWVFPIAMVIGLVIFAYLNGLLAAAGASLSKLILSPRPEEQQKQLAQLAASRTKIVDAFESERRRIERNLHDGVQQELVNLNLRLGLAEMEAKGLADSIQDERASRLFEHVIEARAQLAHAQNTLRDTVRGIYPPVLEDYGLKAALEELARHTLIPVHLTYDAPERLPQQIERAAYYTVTEAVTNTLKYAQAQRISITVAVVENLLVLSLEDDGIGGANLDGGTGLAGLVERAAALGGHAQLDSPQGGPTRLTVSLPLA